MKKEKPAPNPPQAEAKPKPEPATKPSAQTPAEPDKTPKPKSWLKIGLIAISLLSLGLAGYFAYQYYQLKQKKAPEKDIAGPSSTATVSIPTTSPSPVATVIPSPTPTVDPMANWLTYTKKDTCYRFKYPQEVTLKEIPLEEVINLSLWGPTQEKDTELYDGLSLSFSFPLNLGSTSLKDYVDGKVAESQQFGEILNPREAITINGVNGYTYTSEGLGIFQNIYLQSPNKACTVEITDATSDPTSQGFEQTVDQILSTFEFI